ncbi:hypothetical protein BO70DRAFT_362346, partial [Aspergillus heteromorphus CBS 117.55]
MSLRAPLRRGLQFSRALASRPSPTLIPIRSLAHIRPRLSASASILRTTLPSSPQTTISTHRPYSTGASTGKSPGDLIVEELQESYEIAKDEFEIATESTDSSTIYAASDRESARDALDELVAAYTVYTRDGTFLAQMQQAQGKTQADVSVDTGMNPAEVEEAVREEVRKRVGRRVRELVAAVEGLEERAKES